MPILDRFVKSTVDIGNITTSECSTIGSCPFAFNEDSDKAQSYGCLPTPYDIVNMREVHSKTWACHSNPHKPCKGAIKYMKNKGIDCRVIDPELINEKSNWEVLCV